jgi:phage gpG-like protein
MNWLTSLLYRIAGRGESNVKVRVLHDGVQLLAKGQDDLSPLMEQIGRYLQQVSRISFLNQSFDGKKWAPRRGSANRPSILGAVQDLTDGPEIAASRFTDRPALVNTGNLRRSIRCLVNPKTVRITSTAPYAQLQNDGGTASLPVTQAVRSNLATLLRSQKQLRPALGFLFRRESVSATIPARPFLGVPSNAKAKIEAMAQEYLQSQAERARNESLRGGE